MLRLEFKQNLFVILPLNYEMRMMGNFIKFIKIMLNPAHFFAAKSSQPQSSQNRSSGPIVIDKIADNDAKSKWDQQLIIPTILYSKFNVPVPAGEKKRQAKSYPPSLIDYIKRAYSRCEDQSQRKFMENQLRQIVINFEDNLNQVSWQSYPLPQLPPTTNIQRPKQKITNQVNYIKKGQIQLPSSYKIVDQQKPSKAMLLAQKRVQKIEQKLKNENQNGQGQKQEKKFFIGFRNQIDIPKPINQSIKKFPLPEGSMMKINKVEAKQKTYGKIKEEPRQSKKVSREQAPVTKINKKELNMVMKSKEDDEKVNLVAKRYAEFNKIKSDNYQKHTIVEEDDQIEDQKIVGKSKSIEKAYLRITGRPNPDTVRPEPILKQALKHFLDLYKKGCKYEYLIGQLRSIRQDLTVQNIKNSFTVQVYEENFKISLFEDDVAQFKHLQTRLWQLYSQGLLYTKDSQIKFLSYQMVTLILQGKEQNLGFMLTQLPEDTLEKPQIQSCLKLRRMLSIGNYYGFFDFSNHCDNITNCLLNHYIDKIRIKCLLMVCRTCGEKMSLKNLGAITNQDEDVLEALIRAQGGVIENGYLMLKPSYQKLLKSEHLVSKKVSVLLD